MTLVTAGMRRTLTAIVLVAAWAMPAAAQQQHSNFYTPPAADTLSPSTAWW
jgi:hypothetical protein